jgi:serine protease Do
MTRRNLLAVCLLVAACAAPPAVAQLAPAAAHGRPDFVELVRREGATVVNISTTRPARVASDRNRAEPSQDDPSSDLFRRFVAPDALESQRWNVGSGFVITEDGYVLTNAHLVAFMEEATVRLLDRREFKARVVGVDPYTDVALLKIDATRLRKVRIGSAPRLEVGEWVAAIGSPFGFD